MAANALGHEAKQASGSSPTGDGSHVRERRGRVASRAVRRVAEYLRALGLNDTSRVHVLSQEIAASVSGGNAEEHARAAVVEAQARFEGFRRSALRDLKPQPGPLWVRELLATFPEAAFGEARSARNIARDFFDPQTAGTPRSIRFREQTLEPEPLPNTLLRVALIAPAVTVALGLGLWLFGGVTTCLWLAWAGLFAFLALSQGAGFLTALTGFWLTLGGRRAPATLAPSSREVKALPKTALVMPIYHESAEHVFASLAAMRESLLAAPGVDPQAFEIFVLSDSRDPVLAAEEERAFRRMASSAGGTIPFFYRRRVENIRHKAGNLADFFEHWGHRYTYAVVLDADSLMHGETILAMVQRMHASPRLALLQAPIALAGGETLFARTLQFSASVFGGIFSTGLSALSGAHGNYYGHNAVLRVQAFLDCCALPELAGKPPLGGHILSHDFVEAALLCRAGWEVRMADDLAGSFEGLPPTLAEYVARDRRWCQGNLQHFRVVGARGLKPRSRLHLLLGACAYLESPAWLAFIALGVVLSRLSGNPMGGLGVPVLLATAVLLLGPQLLGLIATLRTRPRALARPAWLLPSFLLNLVLAAGLAPLLMLHRTRIVLALLLGRAARWGSQNRRGSASFAARARSEAVATALGVGLPILLWFSAPELLLWLTPVWVPWALSIPIAWLLGSRRAGHWARRLGLLLVPTEIDSDPLIERADELRALTDRDDSARFRDLVLDPVLLAAHVARLAAQPSEQPPEHLVRLRQRALRMGPAGLSPAERSALIHDAESMSWLHQEAWRHWPVESWQIARDRPQVPLEDLVSAR